MSFRPAFGACATAVVAVPLAFAPAPAFAQCPGGLIPNCPAAVSPTASDLLLLWQGAQSPHSRNLTLQTLATSFTSGGLLSFSCSSLTNAGTACTASLGTTGSVLGFLNGANFWYGGIQYFGSVIEYTRTISSATYTAQASDCGTEINVSVSSTSTVTLPNSLTTGCWITFVQGSTGSVSFIQAGGATMASAHNFTQAFGQNAVISAQVVTNVGGSAAAWVLYGDGGPVGSVACGLLPAFGGDATSNTGSCTTSVLTTNGTAFTGSATVDATNKNCPWRWDSNTTVANGTFPCWVPTFAGTINSITYYTNGSGTPSFSASIQIAGSNVTGCTSLTVSTSSVTVTTCSGANSFTSGQKVDVVIASATGSPSQALVQINFHQTSN